MKLHEMLQKRDNIARQMRTIHESIGDKEWSEEQRGQWNNAKKELDDIDAQIARENELRAIDEIVVEDKEKENRSKNGNPETEIEVRSAAAFDKFLRHGLGEMSGEERALLKEMRAQGIDPSNKGGYTVPTQMQARIVESMKAFGGIASVAQILNTSTGQAIEWATADGTAEEGELLGENTAASEEDTLFGTASLGAKKLSSKIIRISNELLQDSGVDIEAYLARRIADRIGRGEAKYLINGTGTSAGTGKPEQPKGLSVSVTGTVNTAAAAKVTWQEILALKHAIDPAYRGGSSFRLAFNDNTLKIISEMTDAQNRPLWLPDIVGVAPASVLNVPYVIDQGIDDIGANKKFIFCGDFNRFIVRRVNYMVLKRLVERYAEFDQTGFLAFHRFDCVLEDTAAIKALVGKGS